MVILNCGTFHYQATIDGRALESIQPVLKARDCRDEPEESLLGPAPQVVLNEDRMAIVAMGRDRATAWKASFAAGDVVKRFARDGDALYLGRDGTGAIGVSLLRHDSLVLAFGALGVVPAGSIGGRCGPEITSFDAEALEKFQEQARADRWVTFTAPSEQCELRQGESARLGGYDIYLDRCWTLGIPGISLNAAIALAGVPGLRDATVRSAVLIGYSSIRITGWEFFSFDD